MRMGLEVVLGMLMGTGMGIGEFVCKFFGAGEKGRSIWLYFFDLGIRW